MKYYIIAFSLALIFSCDKNKVNCREIPYIIVESNKDTLFIGDTLKGNISISDTTFLRMIHNDGYDVINPIIFLEDETIMVKNQEAEITFLIDSTFVRKYCDSGRHFNMDIKMMIPHPQQHGDITLSSGIGGIIKNTPALQNK
jgi:hypothetical protein